MQKTFSESVAIEGTRLTPATECTRYVEALGRLYPIEASINKELHHKNFFCSFGTSNQETRSFRKDDSWF